MSFLLAALFSVVITSLIYLWCDVSEKYSYWEKRKVPHLKPSWPFGTLKKYILLKQYQGLASAEYCSHFPDAPYVGGYLGTKPILYVKDPEYIKTVLVKAFAYMSGRNTTRYANRETLTRFIFFTGDDDWKVLRQNVTPMYSTGKMKNMFPIIREQNHKFKKTLDQETKITPVVNIRELMGRYTMDCISSCAFGVDSNMIGHNSRSNPFRKVGEAVFFDSMLKSIVHMISVVNPTLFYSSGIKLFPAWLYSFFKKVLYDVFKERQYKPSNRNDFVDLTFSLKDQAYITGDSLSSARTGEKKLLKMKVDDDVLLAQCIGIFVAGYETSATAMTFVCYHIAKDERVQALVHQTVDEYFIKHDGKLDYDVIADLPYLEACIQETLRICPIGSNLAREVLYDYTLPDGLKLEAGLKIIIPVYYLHHCSKYFPDPEVFRPERFLGKEKQNIQSFTYLAFGEGPRLCLGERFSKMQAMAGLATLFKNYKLEVFEETPKELTFNTKGLILVPDKKILLKLVPRDVK